MARVAPSERFRTQLDDVLAGVGEEQDPAEVIGRLGARSILQQALEDEVTEFLGRGRYQRSQETVSHRNGYEPKTVKTTSGPMELERPIATAIRDSRAMTSPRADGRSESFAPDRLSLLVRPVADRDQHQQLVRGQIRAGTIRTRIQTTCLPSGARVGSLTIGWPTTIIGRAGNRPPTAC